MLVDVHTAKQSEKRDPEDKQDRVPDEEQADVRDEGDQVEERGEGREGGCYFCVDLCFARC